MSENVNYQSEDFHEKHINSDLAQMKREAVIEFIIKRLEKNIKPFEISRYDLILKNSNCLKNQQFALNILASQIEKLKIDIRKSSMNNIFKYLQNIFNIEQILNDKTN